MAKAKDADVVSIEGLRLNEDGKLVNEKGERVDKNGRPLRGAALIPKDSEWSKRMRAAREAKGVKPGPKKVSKVREQATEDLIGKLEPRALTVIEENLYDEDPKIRQQAAFKLLEYTRGKPVQKIENTQVSEVVYRSALPDEEFPEASGDA